MASLSSICLFLIEQHSLSIAIEYGISSCKDVSPLIEKRAV